MKGDEDNNLVGLTTYDARYYDELGEFYERLHFDDVKAEYDEERAAKYGKDRGYSSMTVEKTEVIVDRKL
jgi:hypothetical protein